MKEKTTKKEQHYNEIIDLICKLYYGCICTYGEKEAKKYISDTIKLLDRNKIKKLKQYAN